MALPLLSKIEAVNIMLEATTEEPVSSLTSGLPEAAKAERFLDRIKQQVLQTGWYENTTYNYTLVRQTSTEILVPASAMRVDTMGKHRWIDAVIKFKNGKRQMFDRKKNIWTFSQDLNVEIVWDVEFDSIASPALRNAIAFKAAKQFQQSDISSVALDAYIKENFEEAWAVLMEEQLAAEDHNMLSDQASIYALGRNSRLYGL